MVLEYFSSNKAPGLGVFLVKFHENFRCTKKFFEDLETKAAQLPNKQMLCGFFTSFAFSEENHVVSANMCYDKDKTEIRFCNTWQKANKLCVPFETLDKELKGDPKSGTEEAELYRTTQMLFVLFK